MRDRQVSPEILDSLPPDDPDAVASRRELRRLNAIMGNFHWVSSVLRRHRLGEGIVLEIGAGDGGLGRFLFEKIPELQKKFVGLDRMPRPIDWPPSSRWHQVDLWSASGEALVRQASVIIANLVLHHFADDDLRHLGTLFNHARVLLINEPARRRLHLWQGAVISPFLNRVTRHDLPVSVRAGFRNDELARTLGLDPKQWRSVHSKTFLGACRLVAKRES